MMLMWEWIWKEISANPSAAVAAIGVIVGFVATVLTHNQRNTFEMIDRVYGQCHALQARILQEWQLSHMYCIGMPTYTDVAKRIKASLPAEADDDQRIRERLRVLERNYAIHIFVVYEQVYFQWKYTPWYQRRRRRFLREIKGYFTGRVLQNPRILAYINSDHTGCSLHLEGESMQQLLDNVRSTMGRADYDGPFGPDLTKDLSAAADQTPSHEYSDTIREMIRHDDEQVNRRITWFCTVQGLLFAAMAFAWAKPGAKPLVFVFAVLGIMVSISTYYAVRAAMLAIVSQRTWWDEHKPKAYLGPDVISRRPDDRSHPWLRPGIVLPFGFSAAWLGVGIVRIVGWV
jgi:hypothetical protein